MLLVLCPVSLLRFSTLVACITILSQHLVGKASRIIALLAHAYSFLNTAFSLSCHLGLLLCFLHAYHCSTTFSGSTRATVNSMICGETASILAHPTSRCTSRCCFSN